MNSRNVKTKAIIINKKSPKLKPIYIPLKPKMFENNMIIGTFNTILLKNNANTTILALPIDRKRVLLQYAKCHSGVNIIMILKFIALSSVKLTPGRIRLKNIFGYNCKGNQIHNNKIIPAIAKIKYAFLSLM